MNSAPPGSGHDSDHELIVAAIAGDVAAFGRLVARYQRDAIRIAAMALGSGVDADDVAQDAFVKVHGGLARFDLTAPFRPWLYRIVVNTARSRQRSGARRAKLRLKLSTTRTADAAADVDHDPADVAVLLDRRQQMVEAINQLSPDDRLILTYRWFDQMSEAEMAEALECAPGTVKSRLSRAMNRLRAEMSETSDQ